MRRPLRRGMYCRGNNLRACYATGRTRARVRPVTKRRIQSVWLTGRARYDAWRSVWRAADNGRRRICESAVHQRQSYGNREQSAAGDCARRSFNLRNAAPVPFDGRLLRSGGCHGDQLERRQHSRQRQETHLGVQLRPSRDDQHLRRGRVHRHQNVPRETVPSSGSAGLQADLYAGARRRLEMGQRTNRFRPSTMMTLTRTGRPASPRTSSAPNSLTFGLDGSGLKTTARPARSEGYVVEYGESSRRSTPDFAPTDDHRLQPGRALCAGTSTASSLSCLASAIIRSLDQYTVTHVARR